MIFCRVSAARVVGQGQDPPLASLISRASFVKTCEPALHAHTRRNPLMCKIIDWIQIASETQTSEHRQSYSLFAIFLVQEFFKFYADFKLIV